MLKKLYRKMFRQGDSQGYSHAKRELEILERLGKESGDEYLVTHFKKEILALVKAFGRSGQSGGSVPYTAGAISDAIRKLCGYGVLSPITLEEVISNEFWNDITELSCGHILYQSKRISSLFKNSKGVIWDIDAIVYQNVDDENDRFTGNVSCVPNYCAIKSFPYTPVSFDVLVKRVPMLDDYDYCYELADGFSFDEISKVFDVLVREE